VRVYNYKLDFALSIDMMIIIVFVETN